MTAAALVADLSARGIHLLRSGDRLGVAPAAALTPDLRDRLAAHKSALLALLAEPAEARTWEEVLRRVDILTAGLLGGGTPENVRLPGAVPVPGLCRYCGTLPLSDLYAGRCDTCAEALWHAVGRAYRQGWRPTP